MNYTIKIWYNTIVKTDVIPNETLAGADVLSNQNETQDKITIKVAGKKICIK